MVKVRGLATTFTEAEVELLVQVLSLQQRGDRMASVGAPAWSSLRRKVLRLQAKARRKGDTEEIGG